MFQHFVRYRAKFSEITLRSVQNAINGLEQPNKLISDAVDVRSELDLRIGKLFGARSTAIDSGNNPIFLSIYCFVPRCCVYSLSNVTIETSIS